MSLCTVFRNLSLQANYSLIKRGPVLQCCISKVQIDVNRGKKDKTAPPPELFGKKKGNKNTCEPPAWFVKKKNRSIMFNRQELTPENRAFLREVVEDIYVNKKPSPLKEEPWERNPYTFNTRRTGVLAIKIGSVPQWKKDGSKIYTTMYQVVDNHVIRYTPPEKYAEQENFNRKDAGCGSVVVGALSCDPMLFAKSYNNLFHEAGVAPKRKLTRFVVTPDAAIQPGTPLYATHFKVGDYVDVQAKTIGHGFQGVMKRWGFKGGPATHGSTKFHRRPGSIGSGRQCSRVRKGKKMPGHMGMRWRMHRGLKIWRINTKYNILYVTGPTTPGPTHCYTRIMDCSIVSKRHQRLQDPPYNPTFFPDIDSKETIPEEILHEELFKLDEPSITMENVKV